jgi:KDO2-lipid IV(A) lauroyltransferase
VAAGKVKNGGPKVNVFVEYLIYLVFRVAEEAICMIREDQKALAVGRFFGRLMFMLGGERRHAAIENLTIAFGKERGPKEIRLIALRNYEHLGMLGVEFFRIRRWSQEKLADKLILEGKHNFDLAWLPSEKGILYIAAHFGSFEVLAAMSRFLGIKGNLVVTAAPNRFVNERMFFRRGGDESGLNILPHRGIVHRLMHCMHEGEMVVVLADQRGDEARPVWVDFFGKKVLANGVFARLAAEGDAYVFPLHCLRTQDGRYRCVFGEEIPVQRTLDKDNDLIVNSQRFHQVFERWLREHPEQGFWMHRKFKRKSRRPKRKEAISAVPAHRIQYDA